MTVSLAAWLLVGIRRRGVPLAQMLADNIREFEGVDLPVGYIDITLYRDDLSQTSDMPVTRNSRIDCDITGKDRDPHRRCDLHRKKRCGRQLKPYFSFGRPAAVQLAVLVDRGHRETAAPPRFCGEKTFPPPAKRRSALWFRRSTARSAWSFIHWHKDRRSAFFYHKIILLGGKQ